MNLLIVIGIIALLLFVLSFVTKRRFGILGLALFAGSFLAQTWGSSIAPYLETSGIQAHSFGFSIRTIVMVVLTLLPALILLLNSPKYHSKRASILGSLAFAVLASVLLVPLLDGTMVIDNRAMELVTFVQRNATSAVTIGIIASIIDLFLARPAHKASKSHEGSH